MFTSELRTAVSKFKQQLEEMLDALIITMQAERLVESDELLEQYHKSKMNTKALFQYTSALFSVMMTTVAREAARQRPGMRDVMFRQGETINDMIWVVQSLPKQEMSEPPVDAVTALRLID